jgi:prepilin-type N-terminal cleavage/methylation domain-containing protein
MLSLKKQNKGFTIIELLIVIVVIGILAALVLNSFQGVQARARDTERRTDINSVATQLEVYYQDIGGYPLLTANINTDSWITTNLKGASVDAFRAPGQTANSMITSATPTKDQYSYAPKDSAGAACTAAPCAKFTLSYKEENGAGATKTKDSLN